MNPVIEELYAREEIQDRINKYMKKYKEYKRKNDYSSMISECNNIAIFLEILGNNEKSKYYYQKIADECHAHLREVPHHSCISALEVLQRPEEALKIVLSNPRMWNIETLAHLYEKVDRKAEAIVLYSGLANHSLELSEAYYPFWRPYYLQDTANLREKAQDPIKVRIYNKKAVEAWAKIESNIDKPLESIEEAWLYEEVGHIYEKAERLETAMKYYERAKSKYEQAHTEDPTAVAAHHFDGDWNDYFGFFVHQIPDFRLIYFRSDSMEENDYRRIKYRILNLEELMKR